MPFTFSHTSIALPFFKKWGASIKFEALVLGSMAPDFVYFIPLNIHRDVFHDPIIGPFYFVPLALVFYLVYHVFYKEALFDLLPNGWQIFKSPFPQATLSNVLQWAGFLIIGGYSHILWDSFTHKETMIGQSHTFFSQTLFVIATYKVYGYKLLQHLSTTLGGFFVFYVLRNVFKSRNISKKEIWGLSKIQLQKICGLYIAITIYPFYYMMSYTKPFKNLWELNISLSTFVHKVLPTGLAVFTIYSMIYLFIKSRSKSL